MRIVSVSSIRLILPEGEVDAATAKTLRDELNAVFPQEEAAPTPTETPLFGAPMPLVGMQPVQPPQPAGAVPGPTDDGITGDAP